MANSPPLDLSKLTPGPAGDAFYTPPNPLPAGSNGDVLWVRPATGATALPSAAHNVLVLYRTTSPRGEPVAVTGVISIPAGLPPAGGWPVISWAHGTTGDAPQCAPSRDSQGDLEEKMLDEWVARGYVVLQTDYEGEGTPGVHPYFVGVAAGRDVTDLVRAGRIVDPAVGDRWVSMGHSEGGHAALFTADVGPQWASELKLLGTVAIAPASHITAALMQTVQATHPEPELVFLAMMIEGMTVEDPDLHLEQVLSAKGMAMMPDLQKRCADELFDDPAWAHTAPNAMFQPNPDLKRLESDFLANEPGALHLHVPVLMVEGEDDDVVAPAVTASLDADLCQRGGSIRYRTFPGEDHGSILDASLRTVEQWVDARFKGEPPDSNCH